MKFEIGSGFRASFCSLAPQCGCHGFQTPKPEQIERHEREFARRLAWCIQNGKVPAYDYVYMAPGDDSQFVYGVPPWHADGTPNPQGIYFSPPSQEDHALVMLQRDAENTGWNCTSCNEWVPVMPREYTRGPEPHDWWWCRSCRATKCKPPQREQKVMARAKTMNKIDQMFRRS
jgi:hypothetical protein